MSRPARVKGDMRGQRSRPEFWFDTGSGSRVESSIKMRAAVLVGFGDVDQLELRDVPEPTTGPGEVKVRVVATSINPIDWKLRHGAKRAGLPVQLPAILGRDATGEVVEVGPGVARLRPGARVAGLVTGGYAERVVAKEDAWAEVPANLRLADAAAVPLVALTGSQLVEEAVRPKAGDAVLVTGALGSVGRVAVFVAKGHGARVWAGVRRAQADAARGLGATGVVAIDDDTDIQGLPELDAIADTVGGATTEKLLGKVRGGGTIGTIVGEPAGAREHGLEVRAQRAHPDWTRLAELLRAVADGALVIPIARRFSLSQMREAQELAERGAGGKVVVEIGME
jgi:NADPH:quinone reductase-like Zn-dependent oxidoreductase